MNRAAHIVLVLIVSTAPYSRPAAEPSAPRCDLSGQLARLPELPEASGIAASRRSPGRFWAHNDSGQPEILALDARGSVVGRVRVTGAKVEDWEAIGVGPCPEGPCLYIGDIGNNDARRDSITIYRVPEPLVTTESVTVRDTFQVRYPDRSQDAEALMITPKGEILIVTKGETGPVSLFKLPADAKPGSVAELQPLGKPPEGRKPEADERITDGAISPSGAQIALRTARAILFFDADEFAAGTWRERGRVSLEQLREPQGEGLTFADEKTIVLAGEGGGTDQPGTFARLTCAF